MGTRKNNKGGNSKLQNQYWRCPDYVIEGLVNAVKEYHKDSEIGQTEGYKRAKGIIEDNNIKYNHLKRIKNWFDSFEGDHEDTEYKLNGGKTMHNWVDSTLNKETEAIKAPKKIKMKTGLTNQFLKSHEKDNSKVNKNTLKIKLPKLHKSSVSHQLDSGKTVYSEEMKRIKSLIKYESKI